MRVLFPERILERHVGGNTTYTRELRSGLIGYGVEVGLMASGKSAVNTAARETLAARMSHPAETVLHFTADTGPLLSARAPSVLTVHGVASRWIKTARNQRQEAIWRFRVQRAIASVDKIITVSDSSARDVSATFNVRQSNIEVIPHGISQSYFDASSARESRSGDRPPFALYIGNIEPRKNLIELVKAFQDSRLRSIGARLVIAGRPAWNYREILESFAGLSNIEYLGFIDETTRMQLLREAHLFVFPSLYEGFGFPVLEALAAGVPVVTSRRGALAEIAGPSWEVTGLSAQELAYDIFQAWQDDDWQSHCAQEGPVWANGFKWESSVKSHIKLYKELM